MAKLVITEKPSVARSIAEVIGATKKENGFLEGNGYIVSWCVGHLVELAEPAAYGAQYEKWRYETLPILPQKWQYMIKSETRDQYEILKKLMARSDINTVVCATDAGREGELIFRLVYEQAGCTKPMERLWISSMEESAIRDGFAHLRPGREYDNLYASARCRQEADWLVGINGTRLFSVLYNKTLKVGRVQSPTLAMLVEREMQITGFKKEPYYIVHAIAGGVDAVSEHIADRVKAEEIALACAGKSVTVKNVQQEDKIIAPPKLYDLTTLQRDANRLFGFTAKQTLEYAQSLYEQKLLTYPRTDSQFLSDDMGETAKSVIAVLRKQGSFDAIATITPDINRILNSKKVTDHHAIIPTVEIANADAAKVPEGERKLLLLAANRLLCATGARHTYRSVKATIDCNGHPFTATGKQVLDAGWKAEEESLRRFLKADREEKDTEDENTLPPLAEGQIIPGTETKVTDHTTQPPKHFTEDSLLSAMERAGSAEMDDDVERKGLGTPATRADVIEKLVKDGFVKREKKQMRPTEDGMKLITILPDSVKSPQMTAEWENTLSMIAKGQSQADNFMNDIRAMVSDLVSQYHEVSEQNRGMFAGRAEVLGMCPKCGKEVVSGKFGAYCMGKCGMSLSRAMGEKLNDAQVKNLLDGKKILMKGLKGKSGKTYDAYLIPDNIEDYSYTKDGKTVSGSQFKFKMEFPNNGKRKKR